MTYELDSAYPVSSRSAHAGSAGTAKWRTRGRDVHRRGDKADRGVLGLVLAADPVKLSSAAGR